MMTQHYHAYETYQLLRDRDGKEYSVKRGHLYREPECVSDVALATSVAIMSGKGVEIGSFTYEYYPINKSLQDLMTMERKLYNAEKVSVNSPLLHPIISKMYSDWQREGKKSFDSIQGKKPVEVVED